MSYSAEIDKAIAAHGMWKARLRNAIQTGSSNLEVDKIKTDNQCDFGRWIHSLPASDKNSPTVQSIIEQHAAFHLLAAKVLATALEGKKVEAESLMSANGEFNLSSAALTKSMMEWKKASL